MNRLLWTVATSLIVGMLAACGAVPRQVSQGVAPPLPGPIAQAKSHWTPVPWTELPGLDDDPLHEAWNAWLKSCERPGPVFAPLVQRGAAFEHWQRAGTAGVG